MIEEIKIAKVATYGVAPQLLCDLRPVNFLFGSNGSGKTTISRIIANLDEHPTCEISWRGGRVLDSLVYNRDFVARNFSHQLRGIFTLGEVEAGKLHAIEKAILYLTYPLPNRVGCDSLTT